MIRGVSASPCPEGPINYQSRPRDSILSLGGDNTADIDFTRDFRASLLEIKPRRRQTAVGAKRRGAVVDFAIHEDQEAQICHGGSVRGPVLAKPAQRPKTRVKFVPELKERAEEESSKGFESTVGARRPGSGRRASILPKANGGNSGALISAQPEGNIKRPARRGTVYIPSDDTTMPSMHMGIFSPIKDLQNSSRGGEPDVTFEYTGLAAHMARKRGRRDSLAMAPAKRVPLQPPVQIVQDSASPHAIPGKKTGKENIPPDHLDAVREIDFDETKLFDFSRPAPDNEQNITTSKSLALKPGQRVFSSPNGQFGTEQAVKKNSRTTVSRKAPAVRTNDITQVNDVRQHQTRPSFRPIPQNNSRRASQYASARAENISAKRRTKAPVKLTIPEIPQVQLQQQYPLLSENIKDPSMYEESWLTHQEIAITQLVNSLFKNARGPQDFQDAQQLRVDLLSIYHDPSFSLLRKRLKASMLYGGLSIPRDVLAKAPCLWSDLGKREKFCSFWLDTYDLATLRAALEVVVGRECSSTPRTSQNGGNKIDISHGNTSRRAVRLYLETFLIRNEDAFPETDTSSREAWSYQRTILRSLLMIRLLDKAKTNPSNPSMPCLFLPTSLHKSSAGVVKALTQMLNPGIGDVLRLLSYLDYFVAHKQYPLEEFSYKIDNLAIDLRDGVRLTRLVELLLYPTASQLLSRTHDSDATTTVMMPTGEILSLLEGEQDWPLSQHLKFPCIGRATKLYNVQIALSALKGVRGLETLVENIQAEDVVDGFREKTVALLWGLSGNWGLGGLIDWNDVQRETRRLSKARSKDAEEEHEEHDEVKEGFESHKLRLKSWASAVASRKGLKVVNLTTSFSDPRVFEAIVDEYEPFLRGYQKNDAPPLPLHQRLAKLGCSAQFAKIYAPTLGCTTGRFFDSDFIVAALAFLCSRLLSTTKQTRAALSIQYFWRQSQERLSRGKRRAAKRVAEDCAAVVQAREKLMWAKTTILSFWRTRRGIRSQTNLERETHMGPNPETLPEMESSVGDVWLDL